MIRHQTFLLCSLLLPLMALLQLTTCDREHKVHNIFLYPERHSWCQTTPIKQVVTMPGYESATIDNNVCVGACYSYSIPRTEPAEPGELIGPYCDSCQPVDTKCYHVTLNASDDNKDGPKTIQKRVQIIMNCSCMSCEKIQNHDCEITDQNTLELPIDLFASLNITRNNTINSINKNVDEVPELLNFVPPKNRTDNTHNVTLQRYELNANMIQLLKAIQEESDEENYSSLNYDKHQLKQLLDMVEGTEHQLNDKNLVDFVNFVNVHNSDNFELNLTKLKDVLTSFREDQELIERHKSFGLGTIVISDTEGTSANINRDLEMISQKYANGKNFGTEGSRLGMGHLKGSHIGMGIPPIPNPNHITQDAKIENHHHHHHSHHHAGDDERVGNQKGHLKSGPHGSLVFQPDIKVEEKLNIDSNMVKPNQEGLVISYLNHPKN